MKKMGPVVTDNSNFLIDFQIGNTFKDGNKAPREIETWLKTIPGILETGLFVDMANQVNLLFFKLVSQRIFGFLILQLLCRHILAKPMVR